MSIQTINPANGKILKTYEEMSSSEVDRIIDKTHKTWLAWKQTRFEDRATLMNNLAKILRKNAPQCAKLMTMEMGKPLTAALAEIEKCAWVCDYYAEHAEKHLTPEPIKTETPKSYICYEPLGIVFSILPWNFPFWQVFRCLAPTLMAGNALLLSHAPISTGTSLLIEKLVKDAGFPKDLFRALVIGIKESARVIAHEKIMGVSLTGSEKAGRDVAAKAGAALKKVVLELGGSDPYVVLEDADLPLAVEACLKSRLSNSGQVCIAAKRIIVVEKIRESFETLLLKKLNEYVMGDPLKPETQLGPMARGDLRKKLQAQVLKSIQEGAKLVVGGRIPPGPGFYYPATLLTNVQAHMTAFHEELFGPVVCIVPAKNEAEALKLANQTRYGLGAAVFTRDLKKGEHIAAHILEAGSVSVNAVLGSDPRLPFGGIKASGYGRELSKEGIREFVNIKTVWVK